MSGGVARAVVKIAIARAARPVLDRNLVWRPGVERPSLGAFPPGAPLIVSRKEWTVLATNVTALAMYLARLPCAAISLARPMIVHFNLRWVAMIVDAERLKSKRDAANFLIHFALAIFQPTNPADVALTIRS
jgi:hypothetical protein